MLVPHVAQLHAVPDVLLRVGLAGRSARLVLLCLPQRALQEVLAHFLLGGRAPVPARVVLLVLLHRSGVVQAVRAVIARRRRGAALRDLRVDVLVARGQRHARRTGERVPQRRVLGTGGVKRIRFGCSCIGFLMHWLLRHGASVERLEHGLVHFLVLLAKLALLPLDLVPQHAEQSLLGLRLLSVRLFFGILGFQLVSHCQGLGEATRERQSLSQAENSLLVPGVALQYHLSRAHRFLWSFFSNE